MKNLQNLNAFFLHFNTVINTAAYPDKTAASSMKSVPEILKELAAGSCQLGILPENAALENHVSLPFLQENLFICVPPTHTLAAKSSVTFSDINGFNFLLKSEIGFWDEMCRKQMPSSRFLVQTDEFEFTELIRESSLPCFTTNLASNYHSLLAGRIQIPVTNPEANVTYYLVCRNNTDFMEKLHKFPY